MDILLNNSIIKFHDDTISVVRREIGLEDQEKMDMVLDILEDWVKKQSHFVKKDFGRGYLERTVVATKGSVERAKQAIDKLCTLKTLMPEFYVKIEEIPKMIKDHTDVLASAILPRLTKEHYRVSLIKQISDNIEPNKIFQWHRYLVVISEYLKKTDYNCGYYVIIDFRGRNILNFVTKTNPIELQQALSLTKQGYAVRIKGIYLLSESTTIEHVVNLFKKVVSKKLGSRIHVHKDLDSLYQSVDKDVLPEEYGGTELPLKELQKNWIAEICSKEYLNYFNEQREACTNESLRLADEFNEQYSGMPGSFRVLNVD